MVYEELAPGVLGYFRSHRMQDPEGLTGDVFVAVVQRLDGFEGDAAALRRWVFTIAHHRRVDAIRAASVRAAADPPTPPTETVDPDPFDPTLVEALGTLTDDQREVLTLRFIGDLAVDDVAELTGRSGGSVKMLQSRGLDGLRRALADDSENFAADP